MLGTVKQSWDDPLRKPGCETPPEAAGDRCPGHGNPPPAPRAGPARPPRGGGGVRRRGARFLPSRKSPGKVRRDRKTLRFGSFSEKETGLSRSQDSVPKVPAAGPPRSQLEETTPCPSLRSRMSPTEPKSGARARPPRRQTLRPGGEKRGPLRQ